MTNNSSFESLLRPHFQRLYKLAWRLAGQKAEAEDLFQELLIKAYGKLDVLRTIDEPGSWLARMMINMFIDDKRRYVRQRMRMADESELPGGDLAELPGDSDPTRDLQRHDNARALDDALSKLSDEHRLVVMLHDAEGYKLKEIQELTGTAIGTVKSRLHRARARLREILEADGTFF